MTQRAFIRELAEQNRQEFERRPGSLKVINLTFGHRWVYLFELVQNALDADAHSISIRIQPDGDTLVLQHDARALDEDDVRGLSTTFGSTKGPSSVGFMGIGFKSVFTRFQQVRISGAGWKVLYETTQRVGSKYGDVQRNLIGAVVPKWDDGIPSPDRGFTTRFELSHRIDPESALIDDVEHILPDDHVALFPILAMSGLHHLELNKRSWSLEATKQPDGTFDALALSDSETLEWKVFPVNFDPSPLACKAFLEHREIQPVPDDEDHVHEEVAKTRKVLGILPLDRDRIPNPPRRGTVYSTLPTEVTLPFGIHIQADWMLDISRTTLRPLKENAWQQEIVDTIPDVLGLFLAWSARTHTNPDDAKAAFKVLRKPSSDESGLESVMGTERWLALLRSHLEDAPILPVWTQTAGTLTYVRPKDALVPPKPLAQAFLRNPELAPALLLRGDVLADRVLGSQAISLLEALGLRVPMTPDDLQASWAGGLTAWWDALPDEADMRRDSLFCIWAAVSELAENMAWRKVHLPCVRTVTGAWIAATEATFLNGSMPNDGEPGGKEVLQLLQRFIWDGDRIDCEWITTLRSPPRSKTHRDEFSRAWIWFERYARPINLAKLIKATVADLARTTGPNPALVSLAHWAMHRQHPDLLTHVLVDSDGKTKSVPVGCALLAEPYVPHGLDRRSIFENTPALIADYVETDPDRAGPHAWRTFFESAGALGGLRVVRKRTAYYTDPEAAARDVALDTASLLPLGRGYRVFDFFIEPALPDRDASDNVRRAIAGLLEDSLHLLRGTGKRHVDSIHGRASSEWIRTLSGISWVPCSDGQLRRPADVLGTLDPARPDEPVVTISSALRTALNEEGLLFGTAIPKAPALRRLAMYGSRLGAAELATLLAECREESPDDGDREALAEIIQNLEVPIADSHVPLSRLVHRVGGSHRGTLGGWIVPLGHVNAALRAELEHPDFPWEFPETTTGAQALAYLLDVYQRARSVPGRLADEVGSVLPVAYAYCLTDCRSDERLLKRWDVARRDAMVFADREWVALADTSNGLYLDNIEDRRFLPLDASFRTVTGGHLARDRDGQIRTAKALGLPLLSSVVNPKWAVGRQLSLPNGWIRDFELVRSLLDHVRPGNISYDGSHGIGSASHTGVTLQRVETLAVHVHIGESGAEPVPVHARLSGNSLTVSGSPLRFGADAAKELLWRFGFRQRAGLAADLAGMLNAMGASEFALAADKFRRSHAPNFDLPFSENRDSDGSVSSSPSEDLRDVRVPEAETDTTTSLGEKHHGQPTAPETAGGSRLEAPDGVRTRDARADATGREAPGRPGSAVSSYTEDRALSEQCRLREALKQALTGKIVPGEDMDTEHPALGAEDRGNTDGRLGDEEYRKVVYRYEMDAGREPELGDPHQHGWDMRSVDPTTQKVRLIEVKGKGRAWNGAEVVTVSQRQMAEAFKVEASRSTPKDVSEADHWYLYVVEKMDLDRYRVLPIKNPATTATKWLLRGDNWRMVAEDARVVTILPDGPGDCSDGS